MRYQGGKSRISKQIAQVISRQTDRQTDRQTGRQADSEHTFVSLFCGSCAIESKVQGFDRVILNDKQKYLVALLKAVQNGWIPPDTVTEQQYRHVKDHRDESPALTGFVGFGCSFGGKWFGGYARNKGGTNYALQSKRSLMKDMASLMSAEFICKDYHDVILPENCVVYADPPYSNTTGYGRDKFDSDAFWEYARKTSQSHLMLISEQNAPSDFIPIWEKPFTRTLDVNKQNQFKVTEKLFVHECQYAQLSKSSQ